MPLFGKIGDVRPSPRLPHRSRRLTVATFLTALA
jgi:hypothetical protein